DQRLFVESLSPAARKQALRQRTGKEIPRGVEFVCVVATVGQRGDGVVCCRSQWPADLQEQGVPAVVMPTVHTSGMQAKANAAILALLIRKEHQRWDARRVEGMRRELLGDAD